MGKCYEEKPFKIQAKRKKNSYDEISGVINKSNENTKRKKTNRNRNNDSGIKKSENNN